MVRLAVHSKDRKLQSLLSVTLGDDYSVTVEPDRDCVKKILSAGQADVLILDFESDRASLGDLLAFLSEIRESGVPIVVMTGDDRRSTAMELVQHGVYDYFRKPPHLLELKIIVRRAHEHAQLRRELAGAREKLSSLSGCDQLIGSSGQMCVVYDLIRRVADLNAFVLIKGESGTGKELVARAIHNLGGRAKSPFVAVSCGAMPESLVEAELFGHERGAFTGASGARMGYLEQAGDGTLFLDEIAELSLNTQVKLLRVLQQKEFGRLGGSRIVPLRARVLFATHRSLAQMTQQGTFRQDLYFRVNVLNIGVPPLRERKEDIPALARHFLGVYAAAHKKLVYEIRPRALELLLDYGWPGNVRELENVIQRAVILAEDGVIDVQSLPELYAAAPPVTIQPPLSGNSFEEQLKDYRARLAHKTLQECKGNKTHAARKLSITRSYLHRLLRQDSDENAAVEQ